jgi:hypothetical protein
VGSNLSKIIWMITAVVSTLTMVDAAALNCSAQDRPEPGSIRTNASESKFTLADGRINFIAPAGFTSLNASELATKFPRERPPRHAVGNASRTTTVAYDLSDTPAGSTDLETGRKIMAQSLEQRVPDLKWFLNTVDQVGSRKWVHLEFTARAVDEPIRCIMLMSVFDGRILMFNFNSTEREFPRVSRALHASMASISVRN